MFVWPDGQTHKPQLPHIRDIFTHFSHEKKCALINQVIQFIHLFATHFYHKESRLAYMPSTWGLITYLGCQSSVGVRLTLTQSILLKVSLSGGHTCMPRDSFHSSIP